MRRFFKISAILAVVIFTFLIAATVILKIYFPPEKIKAIVVTKVTEALGRKVSVGDVDISIFSGVDIHDISVGENPEYGDIPFVKVKRVTVGYNFRELFHKRVVLDRVTIKNPEVFLRSRGGKLALSDLIRKPPAQEKAKAPLPFSITLKRGNVKGLSLFYDADDAKAELKGIDITLDGELYPLNVVNIEVSSRGVDNIFATAKGITVASGLLTDLDLEVKGASSISARGEVSLKGLRVAAKGKGLSPLDVGVKINVGAELNGGAEIKAGSLSIGRGSSAAISGTIKELKRLKGLDIKVTGELDLAEISKIASEFVKIPVTGSLKIAGIEVRGDLPESLNVKAEIYLKGVKVSHKGLTVPLDGYIKGEADNKGTVTLSELKINSSNAVRINASASASKWGEEKVNARAGIVADNAKALRLLPEEILQKVGKIDVSGETLVNLTAGRDSEKGPLKVKVSGSSDMNSLKTGPISVEALSATFSVISDDLLKGKSFVDAGLKAMALKIKKDDINLDTGAVDVAVKSSASFLLKKDGVAETNIVLKGLKLNKGDINLSNEDLALYVYANSTDMFRKTASIKTDIKAKNFGINKADIELKDDMLDMSVTAGSDDLPGRKAFIDAGFELKGVFAKKGDISLKEDMLKASVAASGDFKLGNITLKSLELAVPKLIKVSLEGEVKGWGQDLAINANVDEVDHKRAMDKVPSLIRQKLPKMEVDGRSSISASVNGNITGDGKGSPPAVHGTFKSRDLGLSIPERGIVVSKTDGDVDFDLSKISQSISGTISIGGVEKKGLLDGPLAVSTGFEVSAGSRNLKIKKLSVEVPQKSVSLFLSGDVLEYASVPRPNLDLKFIFNPLQKVDIVKGLNASGAATFNVSIRPEKEKELILNGRLKMDHLDLSFKDRAKVRDLNGDIRFVQGIRFGRELELITEQGSRLGAAPYMPAIYDLMRPYVKKGYDLTMVSASFDEYEVGPLSMDIVWSNGNLFIDRYELALFGGWTTGKMRAVYYKDAPEFSISSNVAGIMLDRIFKDKRGGEEMEINADLNLKGKGTEIEGEVNVTRIGKDLLDRGLLRLDPNESNPQLVDVRRKVNSLGWVPKEVSIWIRHGELNMDITLQRKKFTLLNILSLEKIPIRRVPVGYLIKKGLKKTD